MLAAVKIVFLGSLVMGQLSPETATAPTLAPSAVLAENMVAAPELAESALTATLAANVSADMPANASANASANTSADALGAAGDTAKAKAPQTAQVSPSQRAIPVLGPRSTELEPIPTHVSTETAQAALAQASSQSAMFRPSILRASVAHAADLPPVQPVMPPPPNVRPMESPITPQRVVRPDEITPQAPPAPEVAPFVSRDSSAQKQAELNRREQELLALQQQMESRMQELNSLENRLQGMLQDANNTQESKFKQLVDMYANMKPRQAAQALTSMDEMIAVKILTGMKSKQSGEILSYMNPTHSARLSEVMSKMQM